MESVPEELPEDLGLPEDVPEDVPELEVAEDVPEEVPEPEPEPAPVVPEPPKRGRGRPRKEPVAAPAAPKAPKPKKQALIPEVQEEVPPPQPLSIEQQFENIMYLFKQREIEERQRTNEKYKRMLGL
jgi:hypothetical protein